MSRPVLSRVVSGDGLNKFSKGSGKLRIHRTSRSDFINHSMHSAPKARDVKAWVNGPGYGGIVIKALKARNKAGYLGRCPRLLHYAPLVLMKIALAYAPGKLSGKTKNDPRNTAN